MNKKSVFNQITFSPTGGTKKVADILTNRLVGTQTCLAGCETHHIDLCDRHISLTLVSLSSEDIALIAVPSYGGRVPALALERLAQAAGNGARAILVCVYGNRAYDNTLAELMDAATRGGFRVVAAVAALAEHSVARQVAAGRPDAADVACLEEMADRIGEKLAAGSVDCPTVPGQVPEKRAGSMPGMCPGTAADCVKCGICAEQCPAEAIDGATLKADGKKCISCMRCIAVCPQKARKLNVVITSLGGVALSVLCKKRQECELFL